MRYRYTLLLFTFLTLSLAACRKAAPAGVSDPSTRAYDVEQDLNESKNSIPLGFEEAEGKRIFYDKCIWCHADATPAGPSNRSNLTPQAPLLSDGKVINTVSDSAIQNVVKLGGSAVGKSAMMPPWGNTLTEDEVHAVIAYMHAVGGAK